MNVSYKVLFSWLWFLVSTLQLSTSQRAQCESSGVGELKQARHLSINLHQVTRIFSEQITLQPIISTAKISPISASTKRHFHQHPSYPNISQVKESAALSNKGNLYLTTDTKEKMVENGNCAIIPRFTMSSKAIQWTCCSIFNRWLRIFFNDRVLSYSSGKVFFYF